MSEKRSEGDDVYAVAQPHDEMRALVREAAGPHAPWKLRVSRAARRLGLSFSRAKDFYYGDARVRVTADELERARRALRHKPPGRGDEGTDAEIDRLEAIVARLESVADRLDAQGLRDGAGDVRLMAVRARHRVDRMGAEA